MLRGYRSIILAIGLILSAAGQPPSSNRQEPTENPSAKVEQALGDIAASLRDQNKSPDLDKPCHDREDNRDSDLCAQWKSADAAKSAADATWLFGILGSVIGILTLAAAFSAAKWARKAAEAGFASVDHGEKTLKQADRTSKAELRAYVVINDANYRLDTLSGPPIVSLSLVNVGQTPAFDVCAEGIMRFGSSPPLEHRFDMRENPRTIMGRDLPLPMEIVSDLNTGKYSPERVLHVVGEIRYTDIFKQRWVQRFTLTQFGAYGSGRLTTATRGNSEKRLRV